MKAVPKQKSNPPTFQARCTDVSGLGAGVFRHPDGLTVFVAGAWRGDLAEVEILRQEKRYAFGRLADLIEPSADRRPSPCPHHGFSSSSCGGCPWMMVTYEAQLREKKRIVDQAFERAGLAVALPRIQPVVAAPAEFGYRRRAQLKFDGKRLGFMALQSQRVVDVAQCRVLTPVLSERLEDIRSNKDALVYRPRGGRKWATLDLNEASDTQPDHLTFNRRLAFEQTNAQQNAYMRGWLKQKLSAALESKGRDNGVVGILELFAGAGNFTKVLASVPNTSVFALEANASAIESLRSIQLENVTPVQVDLLRPKSMYEIDRYVRQAKVLVLNPPRTGFVELRKLTEKARTFRHIFYVSCNPHALARDISKIVDGGWTVESVQPVDPFPQTPHVEVLVHMRLDPQKEEDPSHAAHRSH